MQWNVKLCFLVRWFQDFNWSSPTDRCNERRTGDWVRNLSGKIPKTISVRAPPRSLHSLCLQSVVQVQETFPIIKIPREPF